MQNLDHPDVIEASAHVDIAERLAAARLKTWAAMEAIASQMKPGMTELEAIKVAQSTLAQMGSRKFWHKAHVRFGKGTARGFNDPYENNVLQECDIFYIDIGPIWDGIEGDAADTYVLGSNPEYSTCMEDAKRIFQQTADHWRKTGANGPELYEFAAGLAQKDGWVLSPDYVRGHRISEFPHSFHTKQTLESLPFHPTPDRWVLEIQICDPQLHFGGYYEDILNSNLK